MQIFCYSIANDGLDFLGLCENATSILWTRNFYQGDTFSIRVPATPQNIKLFAKYQLVELMFDVSYDESKFCGVITDFTISRTASGEEMVVSGMSPDGFLQRRILRYQEKTQTLMQVINENLVDNSTTARSFPATSFVYDYDVAQSTSEALVGSDLGQFVKIEGEKNGVGLQSYVVHNDGKPYIIVKLRKGVERTTSQTENKAIIISDSFDTAYDMEYDFSDNGSINSVLIYSPRQLDETSRIAVREVNEWFFLPKSNTKGYMRTEKMVRITPVKMDYEENDGSIWKVLDEITTLEQAEEKAGSTFAEPTEFFDGKLLLPASYTGVLELGDIVTVQNVRWGITADKRITELVYQWGNGEGEQLSATMGETYKGTLEIVKNKLGG